MFDSFEAIINIWGLPIVIVLMIFNGVISFPPSEIVISLAGMLLVSNREMYFFILIIIVAANFFGNIPWFVLSRKYGDKLLHSLQAHIDRIRWVFLRKFAATIFIKFVQALSMSLSSRGQILVFYCRCLPLVRSVITIPAGLSNMKFTRFSLYTIVGQAIWATAWLFVGTELSIRSIENLSDYVSRIGIIVVIVLLSFSISFYIRKRLLRKL